MTMHSKTQRRVVILVAAVVGLSALGGGAYFWRNSQIAYAINEDRIAGLAALEERDYTTALHKIGRFVQRNPKNVAALGKYAEARRNVEEPNGKHIVDAIALYRRVLELDPYYPGALDQLLELYLQAGFNTEILAATDARTDNASVRARALALGNLGRSKEAVEVAETYLAARPDDLRTQFFVVSQMQQLGRPLDELLKYADTVVARFPQEPQYQLLVAYVHTMNGDRAKAVQFARTATEKAISIPEQVELATDLLDAIGESERALSVLRLAGDAGTDPRVKARVVTRLFQSQQYEEVATRLKDVNPTDPKANITMLAHKAMTATALGRTDEADSIIASLASRKENAKAMVWARVLESIPKGQGPIDDKKIIEACRDGLRVESDNAYFYFHLGDAYDRLGETEMAMKTWTRSAELSRVWPPPLTRLIQALLLSGRGDLLQQLLPKLEELSSGDPKALAIVAAGKARLTDPSSQSSLRTVIPAIDRVLAISQFDPTALQLKLAVISKTSNPQAAAKWATDLIAANPAIPTDALLSLARVSEAEKIGVEKQIYDHALASRPPVPELALSYAGWLIRTGKADQAVAAYTTLQAKASEPQATQWRLGHAVLLEQAQDATATKVWTDLVDAAPDDLSVQRAGLISKSLLDQADVLRRVVDRLGKVIGDEGVSWRMADARLILQKAASSPEGPDREREIVRATTLLGDVSRRYPDQTTARLMLAGCYLELGKRDDAINQLSAVVSLLPNSVGPTIELASLLQAKGDFDQAGPYLLQAEKIISQIPVSDTKLPSDDPSNPNNVRLPGTPLTRADAIRSLSSLYTARGDAAKAVELLRQITPGTSGTPDPYLAELLALRGELTEDMLRGMLEKPTARTIELIAEHYARSGRLTEATAALAKLDSVEATPGQREVIRGLFARRRGDYPNAIENLRASTRADNTNPIAWKAYVESLVLAGRGQDAVAAAREAQAALPAEESFAAFVRSATIIPEVSAVERLRPLVVDLLSDTTGRSTLVEALAVAAQANNTGKTVVETTTLLRPLAERPDAPPSLRFLMVDLYEAGGNINEALALASRIAAQRPNDPNPLRRSAEILSANGRWQESLAISQQWRAKLGRFTYPADVVIARAYVALGQHAQALATIDQYAAAMQADPAGLNPMILLKAQALVGAGRITDSEKVLFPSLASDARYRGLALDIAGNTLDAAAATRWIDAVTAATGDKVATAERLAVARTWLTLAARVRDTKLNTRVDSVLAAAVGQLDSPSSEVSATDRASLFTEVGILYEARGNITTAVDCYRKAIAAGPGSAIAKNNLAAVAVTGGGDLNEALQFATEAAAESNHPALPDSLDTLASVQAKLNNIDGASASLNKAISLAPDALVFRIHLVDLLLKAGRTEDARKAYQELASKASAARINDKGLDAQLKAFEASFR